MTHLFKQIVPDPTPQEIFERSAEIRSRWNEKIERKRQGLPLIPIPYTVPMCHISNNRDGTIIMEAVEQ